jgi:hypothetical protein
MSSAKHTHYRSLANGIIYPAMTSTGEDRHGNPVFYQDEHPTEWQPATAAEYAEQCRRENLLARRADVIDVSPTPTAPLAPPAPATGIVPPPPAAEVEA